MKGFFQPSSLISKPKSDSLIPKCGACGLYKKCKSPKMEPTGKGRRRILVVGEAPGEEEDKAGKQFIGRSGQLLESELRKVGIDFRKDCWITNAIICRPPDNETPDDKKLEYCRPNLTKTIRDLNPEVIVPVGGRAVQSVLHGLWRDSIGSMLRWIGWKIPNHKPNAWVCPIWHPAYLLRANDPAMNLYFGRHLKAISELESRPWVKPPDYKSQVEVVIDPQEAAHRIHQMTLLNQPAAFDYETNKLKPDSQDAEIVCCSISWGGVKTIAYPWTKLTEEATFNFLRSDCPKVASNLKFEDRWSRRFGVRVKNWAWDTMLAAHVCDNRPEITSIKFQAFVRLGMPIYDGHIRAYLESEGGNTPNRVRQADINQLLLYCGLDSLLEYKVAELQMKELGYVSSVEVA